MPKINPELIGALATVGAGSALIKSQLDNGNLTGRELVYHNTHEDNVDSIKQKGILKSKSYDKNNITHKGLKGVVKTKDMQGLTYVGRTKTPAIGVGLASAAHESKNNKKNLAKAIIERETLKAKVPIWKMKKTDNPELMDTKSAKDFAPIVAKRYHGDVEPNSLLGKALKPADIVAASIMHKNLGPEKTYTLEDTIKPQYIKGSDKYKRADKDEVSEYIKNNPGRFAKGLAASGLGVAGTVMGAKNLRKSLKKVACEDIEKQASAKQIAGGVAGAALLLNSPDLILGKKKVYHGTSKDNWENIKSTGFRSEFGGNGVSSIDKKLKAGSKKMVHVTATKPIANYHAAMLGRPDKFKTTNIRLKINAEKRRLENKKNPTSNQLKKIQELDELQKALFPISQREFKNGHFINTGKNGKIIKAKIDYDTFKNMEVDRDLPLNKYVASLVGDKGDALAKQIAAKGDINIPIEEIQGSDAKFSDRARHTFNSMPSYIKNNPGRFGLGVGSAGAGALLMANALKGVKR